VSNPPPFARRTHSSGSLPAPAAHSTHVPGPPLRRLGILALATALALGSCGEDAKASYIEAADAICTEANEDLGSLPPPPDALNPTDPDPELLPEALPFLEADLELVRGTLARLRALELPDEDADVAREWLDVTGEQVSVIEELIDAARAKDAAAFRGAFARGDQLNREAAALARRFGFQVCGA
jgi:hypothetical protein